MLIEEQVSIKRRCLFIRKFAWTGTMIIFILNNILAILFFMFEDYLTEYPKFLMIMDIVFTSLFILELCYNY